MQGIGKNTVSTACLFYDARRAGGLEVHIEEQLSTHPNSRQASYYGGYGSSA